MTDEEIMKRVHEINIGLLEEFDRICRKHSIQYFAAFGTLLGAVRHKGMIPWDDDVDIWMTREEYAKFRECRSELNSNYELAEPDDYGSNRYYDLVHRLQYKDAYIKIDEERSDFYKGHLNRISLDIFFLDETLNGFWGTMQRIELLALYSMMNAYRHPKMILVHFSFPAEWVYGCLRGIGHLFSLSWLKKRAEKVAIRYNHSPKSTHYFDSTLVISLLKNRKYPKNDFSSLTYTEFESIEISVPNNSDEVLSIIYGDYMKLPPEEERVPHLSFDSLSFQDFQFDE